MSQNQNYLAVIKVVGVGGGGVNADGTPYTGPYDASTPSHDFKVGPGVAPKVDLYAEIRADGTEVFVRDRGQGFVIDEIAHDRHGVRGSIIDRMQRHGGTAMVNTRPGQGTEIRLAMPKKEES